MVISMKIGVVGTGGIASAVVTGFCLSETTHEFFLSPRNAQKSAALASDFSNVTVCTSNQEVVEKSDCIFICLQKKDFAALHELKYHPKLKVINMAAEMRLPDLKQIVGDAEVLAHVIPLPCIVMGIGPLLIYPENKEVGKLFAPVGDVYFAKNQKDVHTLQIVTGMMSAYYMLMQEVVKFADDRGIEHEDSVKFLCSLIGALCQRPVLTGNTDLTELANDMTPGGYNEQAMNELTGNGAIGAWREALDNLLMRLQKSGHQ